MSITLLSTLGVAGLAIMAVLAEHWPWALGSMACAVFLCWLDLRLSQ